MTGKVINIVSAQQAGDCVIHLVFDDGTAQDVDFKPFLTHSSHPDIKSFLDPARFAGFRIEYGELVWGDYELCFPIEDLYKNRIDNHASIEKAA